MIIELVRFMSHDHTTVELPSRGLVQVVGPNGAGKSALVEGISTALWGRGTRSSKWAPWRPEKAGVAAITDGPLSVRRTCSASGKKQLTWSLADSPKDFDTTTKGQEALDNVIGSFEAWRRTNVFSSADAAHFTLATDAERKELLEELLGLGWFDSALQACRKDLHAARSGLGQAERDRDVYAARADEAAKAVHQAQSLLMEASINGDVSLLRVELAKVEAFLKDAVVDRNRMSRTRTELAGVGGEALARTRDLRERIDRLSGDACYACGQEIPQALRDKLEAEVSEQIRIAAGLRQEKHLELGQIESQIEEVDEEVESLRAMQRRLHGDIDSITKQRGLRDRLLSEAKAAGAKVMQLGYKVADTAKLIEQCRVDVAELEACERVLGVRGARSLLVGRTLASVESLTNAWMSRLGSDILVNLKPYTEKKSGGTVDSISLQLVGAGGDGGYLGASAGERRRVDVAVLLALAELADGAAQGRRWRSPVVFDEVFDGLDEDGREAVVELMTTIAQERLVILITHNEGLAADRADLRLRVDNGVVK